MTLFLDGPQAVEVFEIQISRRRECATTDIYTLMFRIEDKCLQIILIQIRVCSTFATNNHDDVVSVSFINESKLSEQSSCTFC